ncbi:bifunctional 2',3'-cyclic-nucleotide 2'-phosphodiesterase/3'-nucleotidase [Luteibacter aegosomaticola]|uniref:bifunctional 2',3'-cyclic-nucleotide 2'-phosphodiesterase/3'-nucleotidase n=1 Tax=Luteibacter aegosomaticola TaxID=2911538 RepID=UPI001FFA4ABE|nr:bifunctional 2',3'-cyclic-nucleotide 2'-phosphodiesterase/3'-nucleotidase [Luteibacter aegosomaticola]UPG89884.1 bifunctional 2',3'-cyclic-nucleotide 2'-phosphodiesterase/3'-nucleotidase [Luteibacter aegosomaticola]
MFKHLALASLSAALLAACASTPADKPAAGKPAAVADGATLDLAILETTDVHSNILSYDYYKQKDDPSFGYERTATLIRQARKEFPNTVLFDSGDTIQGSVLADYQALVKPIGCDTELGIYKAMDSIGYDGGTAGNHEFNYGLPFLAQVTNTSMNVDGVTAQQCAGPKFPLVLSNVDSARDGKPIFKPWTIVTKTVMAKNAAGKDVPTELRIAIVGFTPPPILDWDKRNLQGKVTVTGVVEAAQKYMPEIQAQHPDLVVAILHGGLNTAPYTPQMENGGWYLAGVPGIDALLLGHSHTEFPGPRYEGMKDVDAKRGIVRGVPAVMGGFFGKDLGVINLSMTREGGRWVVQKDKSHSQVRPICQKKGQCVDADPAIAPLVQDAHQAAVAYVNTPIGETTLDLSSYFADEGNMTAISVVNAAQADYARDELARSRPDLKDVPVISAASAFRTGFGGPDDFTDVPKGPLTIRSASDLYFYPNTLGAVKIDGAGVKAWLEKSATRFNQIDPSKEGEQAFIGKMPGYNFDQIQGGLTYTIDVTKPEGQRIGNLRFKGKPVKDSQPFIVVTNSYRANGGGEFPGMNGDSVVLSAPDGNREIVIKWIEAHKTLTPKLLDKRSWTFVPVKVKGPVTFTTASGKEAVAKGLGLHVTQLKDNGDGTAVYAIDLSKK